jgi:TRAP-type C4-dicarboxylate transport system permease small subunit
MVCRPLPFQPFPLEKDGGLLPMFWKIHQYVSDKMKMIGAACLFGMALLTAFDVVGRLFKHPIFGSVELVTYLAVFVVAMALPYTHENRGHIGVELFVRKFSRKTRAVIDIITGTCSLILFALVAWRMFLYADSLRESGEVSMNLEFPEYTVVFAVAVSCIVFCLSIVRIIVENIAKLRAK